MSTRADLPVKILGDFRILREVGRGGMGVVYEAEQISLGRRVALKVLPPRWTADPRQIGRFRREAAAAGRLQHPGVVPIYTVDEAGGACFYAMEFVEGGDLATLKHDVRARCEMDPTRTEPSGRVRPAQPTWVTEVAEVVAQAAEALAAAHAEGLIHRDVKPQNILLGPDGKARLVDFGLARELAADVTLSQGVMGTPRYMSPEQFEGADLDARTDVFSLGVVLYELLTLSFPFDGDTPQQLFRAVALQEPAPPRRHNPRIPRDLDIICAKTLEKDRRQRYADAGELARDLRRFLAHEPISAEPPGLATRATKFVRRHRATAVAAVLAFLLVIVGPLAFGLYMKHARDALSRVQQQTLVQRNQARDNLEHARQFLNYQLAAMQPLRELPAARPTYDAIIGEAVDHFTELLDRLEEQGEDRLEVLRDVAKTTDLVAKLHGDLGRLDRAVEFGNRSVAAWRRVLAVSGDAWDRITVAQAHHQLANDRRRRGDADAESDEDAALATLDAVGPEIDERTRAHVHALAAAVHGSRGLHRLLSGSSKRDAEIDMQRAAELWAGVPAEHTGETRQLLAQCDLHESLGQFYRDTGDRDSAMTHLEAGLRAARRLVGALPTPEHRHRLAIALLNLGAVLGDSSRPERCAEVTGEAVEVARQLVHDCPTEVEFRALLANLLLNSMFLALNQHGPGDEVAAIAEEAIGLVDELVGSDGGRDDYRLIANRILDAAATTSTSAARARELFGRAIGVLAPVVASERHPPAADSQWAGTLCNFADLELRSDRIESARDAIERAIPAQQRALDHNPDDPYGRAFMRSIQWVRGRVLLRLNAHAGVTDAVAEMVRYAGEDPRALRYAAEMLARCVTIVRETAGRDERERLAVHYGNLAIGYLERAVEAGSRGSVPLAEDPVFEPLRDRPEFTALTRRSDRAGQ